MGENGCVAGFGGVVGEKGVAGNIGGKSNGKGIGGGCDETVDQNRQMLAGRSEEDPGHRGDFKTSEAAENRKRGSVGKGISMERERMGNAGGLVLLIVGGKPCSRPCNSHGIQTKEGAVDGRGCGGVANAHFANGRTLAAIFRCLAHQVDAVDNALDGLLLGHGRFFREILCAIAQAPIQERGMGAGREGAPTAARIHKTQRHAGFLADTIDGTPAVEEIDHHLARDRLWIG